MGLAASQTRFLSLTARKSDLEFQAQMLNTRRTQLATDSANVAKAYSFGMANQAIRISEYNKDALSWELLDYNNLTDHGFMVVGMNGAYLNPNPYTEYEADTIITSTTYGSLTETQRANCEKNADGSYTVKNKFQTADASFKGMDLQTLLMSAQGQVVSKPFFAYLCQHGYQSGSFYDTDENGNKTEVSYAELLDRWQANIDNCNPYNTSSIIDWSSDVTSTFKSTSYTEDDTQVAAEYESRTAEIQAQDKQLEMQIKNIETEHKAIETEMESVKKVIDKNIENSFKTFG